MTLALNDLSDLVDPMSSDAIEGRGVGWVAELAQRLVDDSGIDADVALGMGDGRDSWDVAVMAGNQAVALIAVVADVDHPLDVMDRIEAMANRRWRRGPSQYREEQIRPWIGVAVTGRFHETSGVDTQLQELTRHRTLDSAFSNVGDRAIGDALGAQSFAASLLGRFVVVRTVLNGSMNR